jgi:hypothetical protein
MYLYRKIQAIGLACCLLIVSSCNDYLDINTDPNNPVNVPVSQLLPAVVVSMAVSYNYATGFNSWAQNYMQQTCVRGDYNINNLPFDDFAVTAPWSRLYQQALTDISKIEEIASADGNWHYVGVAQLLKAHIYSYLVDMYGDLPYFNANLGAGDVNPTFDDGEVIYTDLFLLIDSGIANLEKDSDKSPGADDLFYGGDLDKWRKFGNTLKLKMLNQVRLTRDVSTEVNALIASGDLISSDAESFELVYGTSVGPDDRNPDYVAEYAPGGSSYINPYFYEILTNKNTFAHNGNIFSVADPRLPYYFYNQTNSSQTPENPTAYFDPATGFLSIYTFSFNIDPNEGFDQGMSQTAMGLYPIGGRFEDGQGVTLNNNGFGKAPLRLLPYFNVLYTKAELALAGITAGDDAALLDTAIRESFAEVNRIATEAGVSNISATAIDNYVASITGQYAAGDDFEKMQILMTQKWISSFGFAVDAYNDYRRTGYPLLHNGSTDNLSITNQTRGAILSFPYPQSDLELYLTPPAQRNPYVSKVFWDN